MNKNIFKIQLLVLLYSLSSVLSKYASRFLNNDGLFSFYTILTLGCIGIVLMIYAYFWQKILKKVDLSVAYLNKATLLFWSMIWSVLLFKEAISLFNILGVIIIFIGIIMVGKTNE